MESQDLLMNKKSHIDEMEKENSDMIIGNANGKINEIADDQVKKIVNNDDIVANEISNEMIIENMEEKKNEIVDVQVEIFSAENNNHAGNENSDDMIIENSQGIIKEIVNNQFGTISANSENLSAMTLDDSEKIISPSTEIKKNDKSEFHCQVESEIVIPQISHLGTNEIVDNHVENNSANIHSLSTNESINSLSTELEEKREIIESTNRDGNVSNSLGLLAAYDSDCDSVDGEIKIVREEINIDNPIAKDYRTKNVESSDSSDSEDDSSSSSSSSSSSMSSSSSEDENEDSDNSTKGKQTSTKKGKKNQEKGEYDNLPPIEELKISVEEVRCDPLGEVAWMVEQMVIVKPKSGKPTLNLDTILFLERGKRPLGRIFDVFGQVSEPHYCVRFNTSEHIKESDVRVGMPVYFVPNSEHTSLVFMYELLKMRAIDDIGEDERPAFSDDEEEAAYEASLRKKQNNQASSVNRNSEVPAKRPRTANKPAWKSQHPWSSEKRHQRPNNNSRSWQNNQAPAYRGSSPAYQNYNQMMQPNPYQFWPGNQYGHNTHQPRSYFPPQSFSGNSNLPPRHGASFGWQQQPPPANIQFPPWITPPPPPPPGV